MRTSFISLVAAVCAAVGVSAFDYPYNVGSDVSVVSTSHNEVVLWGRYGRTLASVTLNNSWSSNYETFATYNRSLDNGYELWNLQINAGQRWNFDPRPEFEIAGFVSYDKKPRVWDPLNNYYVYQKGTPAVPAVLLTDKVSYDTKASQIALSGSVRTYSRTRAADYKSGNLIVRWTTDDFKTYTDSPANPPTTKQDDTWSFNIPIAKAVANVPQFVKYAIQYKPTNFWANNNNENFKKFLQPTYTVSGDRTGLTNEYLVPDATGVPSVNIQFYSDLPLGLAMGRVDAAEYTAFNGIGNFSFTFNAYELADGNHTLDVTVPVENGPTIFKMTIPFTVKNKIKFLGQWKPTRPEGLMLYRGPSSSAVGAKGSLLLGWDGGYVYKYASVGSDTFEALFRIPGSEIPDYYESVKSVAEIDGKVYAYTTKSVIYRWNADATLDTTFGTAGALNLRGPVFGTAAICFIQDAKMHAGFIFVVDGCGQRLLKFSPDGAYIADIGLPFPSANLGADGETLLAFSSYSSDYKTKIAKINPYSFTLPQGAVIDLSGIVSTSVSNVEGIADAFAVTLGGSMIFFDKKTGEQKALWSGAVYSDYPGTLATPRGLLALADGSLIVTSSVNAAVQRFSQTLLA
ncbi:hypothetical protein BC829DRAFT_413506 [Chytridium lagenaria]|nr:hypothetical protein BC829DRAFT_413506 [Chytridium lagenaria]